ncbi:hypothetical protein EU546_07310 [Candidatus Thorarchaeota archaeon]|nr:MAG: hypothetical protein EU546_07310 [Candidatus Thorarchaeota archaeon]
MEIPILSSIITGLKVFFETRRYVAYLIIFVASTFLALFVSWLMTAYVGTFIEEVLVNFFVYVGATGTIYFALGSVITGLKLDKIWITRRGRGKATEMKGVAWLAVSFAIAVFLSILTDVATLLFFSMFCWVGWIAFQAFLSSRTSLRLASIAEPKKGGIAIGIGSFIILLIGIGIIAAEILLALVIIPNNLFGIGDILGSVFSLYQTNIETHGPFLLAAMALLGLFALVSLVSFLKYARKGAALNIALLTVFIAVYSGYFLFNVLRRTGAPSMTPVDIGMSLFFLVYAMSGIGRTVTEAVEDSRSRLRDFGPLFTFFLASGFFFVDSIIAVTSTPGTLLASWFNWTEEITYATFLFRDIAKLLAFPLVAILTSLYYLRVERVERIVTRARAEGETFEPDEVDEEIAEQAPAPGEAWPSERAEGVKEGRPGHSLSAPDTDRLSIGKTRRLGKAKRLGEEEEEEEE